MCHSIDHPIVYLEVISPLASWADLDHLNMQNLTSWQIILRRIMCTCVIRAIT